MPDPLKPNHKDILSATTTLVAHASVLRLAYEVKIAAIPVGYVIFSFAAPGKRLNLLSKMPQTISLQEKMKLDLINSC